MVTLAVHSLPLNEEYPHIKGRVRGEITISMVFKGVVDPESGQEHTEVFMTNMCDINGVIPKWLVNAASKSVPKLWFKTYESGCQKTMKKIENNS